MNRKEKHCYYMRAKRFCDKQKTIGHKSLY